MSWLVILVIIGVIIFFFLRDRDKMLNIKVDSYGGMEKKYSQIVEWMTQEPGAKIVNITRDHIQTSYITQTTATYFFITETFNGVEIEWDARLGFSGNHKLKWKFQPNTNEEVIIVRIGTEIQDYYEKMY